VRLLGPGDEQALERFLRTQSDSSLLMLSNLASAGIEDLGEDYQGSYAAAFSGQDITSVAAHYWNGCLLLQAPNGGAELAALALAASGRPLKGILGPAPQVAALRRELKLLSQPCRIQNDEDLMGVDFAALRVPEALESIDLRVRLARSSELDLLVNWRVAFAAEALGDKDSPDLRAQTRAEIARWQAAKVNLVLEQRGRLVATCSIIADYGTSIQLGTVWTPPPLRGRGFARCLVAGALLRARGKGKTRAVLITSNPAAKRAYRAVGFQVLGAYSLVLFRDALRFTLPKPPMSLAQPKARQGQLAKTRGAA
jgi:RimJ/RimL family protein N-acetyltransferase